MTSTAATRRIDSEAVTSGPPNLAVQPLDGPLGCAITGLDLSRVVDDAAAARVRDAFIEHKLIVFPRQSLGEADLVRVSHLFGDPVVHHVGEYLDQDFPQIMRLSNNVVDGKPLGAPNNGIFWHSDQIFREQPMLATLLYGVQTPLTSGGDTLFSDMYAAFEALPEEMQAKLLPLQAVHSFVASYERNYVRARSLSAEDKALNPDVVHPVVRTHPQTGRKALFVDPDSVTRIMGVIPQESEDLLSFLFAHIADERFVYRHAWTQGDLAVWDNRCLMHCATSYDDSSEIRLMFRTQTQGDRPV
ncbi:MAG: TauD/TfdA family dioxygenase [Minwuia sp.]|nr:TauD/TfdA family dioxygenase [Minwuia sp.]